jgi:hypothetical protein
MTSMIVGSQGLTRDDVLERDYLNSMGDVNRSHTNATRTHVDGPGVGFIETLAASDNNEARYFLNAKVDPRAAGGAGRAAGRIRGLLRFTEANTNAMDWFFGLSSGLNSATGTISNTQAQLTSGDHIGFFKAGGALALSFIAVANGTHTALQTTGISVVSGTEYALEVAWQCGKAGINAQFYVDDVKVGEVTNLSYENFGSMFAGFQFKSSGAAEVGQVRALWVGNTHR